MRIFRLSLGLTSLRALLLPILLLFLSVVPVRVGAANIDLAYDRNGRDVAGILIEGNIEKGDFQKFAALALSTRGLMTVYLASPGGDLSEAMRIGKLVRSLYFETWAPLTAESSLLKLTDNKNNVCASSCFFIYAAGAKRVGRVIGIHRPYLPQDEYKKMGISAAESSHNLVREVLDKYMREMNVPTHYLDKMMAISSDGVEWIPEKQIRKDLEGFTPAISEWMAANCRKITAVDEQRHNRIVESIPKERSHLPMRLAPSRADDREFLVTYWQKMRQQQQCEESGLTKEREVIRGKILSEITKGESPTKGSLSR